MLLQRIRIFLNELNTKLGTPVKEKAVFCLAQGWDEHPRDNTEGYFVQYLNGSVLTHPIDNINHCKDYFVLLLNEE